MAVIYEDSLEKILKSGNTGIYILFGDDGYLKKMYKDKISRGVCDVDDIFNFQAFSADCDLQEVYDAVLQFPMMSDKKCIILEDYNFDSCAKYDFDKLCTVLQENPETCVLILWFNGLDIDHKKNSRFKKMVELAEKNNGVAVQLSHRSIGELVKMLTKGAVKRGCSFETGAARYLVEAAGQDINILVNELEKLCAFVKKGVITKGNIEEVAIKTVEARIFDLANQIVNCNIDLSIKTIDELFFMRVEPIIILSTVASFFVDLYRVFTGGQKGISIDEISEKFGYGKKKFLLEKAQVHLKKFDSNKFNLCFDALSKADKSLKAFSADSRTVLEQLIIRLCYIITKGDTVD